MRPGATGSGTALPLSLFFASFLLLAQVAAPPSPARLQARTRRRPSRPSEPIAGSGIVAFPDRRRVVAGAIKPAAIADYEQVIRTVQEALAKDADPTQRSRPRKGGASSRPSEADAKGNAIYIHLMLPTVTGFDYRPSLLLDELVKELAPELLSKYQEAFAMPPSKLNLTEFANMSVAPLPRRLLPQNRKADGHADRSRAPRAGVRIRLAGRIARAGGDDRRRCRDCDDAGEAREGSGVRSGARAVEGRAAGSSKPVRRTQAAGWSVFKSSDLVQGNVSYIMRIDPAVRDRDYDLARLIGEADPGAASEVTRSIRDAQVARR